MGVKHFLLTPTALWVCVCVFLICVPLLSTVRVFIWVCLFNTISFLKPCMFVPVCFEIKAECFYWLPGYARAVGHRLPRETGMGVARAGLLQFSALAFPPSDPAMREGLWHKDRAERGGFPAKCLICK